MKKTYTEIIDRLSNEELFNYLTKDRIEYNEDAIEYAEYIFENRKLNWSLLQTESNQLEIEVEEEVLKRILNGDHEKTIIKHLELRGLKNGTDLVSNVVKRLKVKREDSKIRKRLMWSIFLFLISLALYIWSNNLDPYTSQIDDISSFFSILLFNGVFALITASVLTLVVKLIRKKESFKFKNIFSKVLLIVLVFINIIWASSLNSEMENRKLYDLKKDLEKKIYNQELNDLYKRQKKLDSIIKVVDDMKLEPIELKKK